MSIRINWTNPNVNFDKVKIYRSLSKFSKDTLPTVLVELTEGATYLDTTTKLDTLYWYAVGVVSGVDEIISFLPPAIQLTSIGPGPKTLLRGNNQYGYFGTVTTAEFFTGIEVALPLGYGVDVGGLFWDKFIYEGKILYIPNKALYGSVTWRSLYLAGAVYGTDDNGPEPATHGFALTNQIKIISKGDDDFIIRLPRMTTRPDRSPQTPPQTMVSYTDANVISSEWTQCILASFAPSLGPRKGFFPLIDRVLATADWPATGSASVTLGCECSGTMMMFSLSPPWTMYTGLSSYTTAVGVSWRPVLELRPPVRV